MRGLQHDRSSEHHGNLFVTVACVIVFWVAGASRVELEHVDAPRRHAERLPRRAETDAWDLVRTGVGLDLLDFAPAPLSGVRRGIPQMGHQENRLQEVALRIERGEGPTLTLLAAELGYTDQAHLARDFKSAVGKSPTDFASSVR